MNRPIRDKRIALVADQSALFRAGLMAMLRQDLGIDEVIETESLDDAVAALKREPILLATFDFPSPGLESAAKLRTIRDRFSDVYVAVLAASLSREDMLLALSAGAHGYVSKTLGVPKILDALRRILLGEIYVPPEIAAAPSFTDLSATSSLSITGSAGVSLTRRQRDVLQGIGEGKSNRQIARDLGLTENTVKVHVHSIFRELEVHSRTSAAAAFARLSQPLAD